MAPKYEYEGVGGDGGFEPVPKGDYTIKIDSVEAGISKSSQKEQFIVKAHVIEGPMDGKEVTIFYSRVPKSLWKWRQLLDASGIDYECEELEGETPEGKPLVLLSFDTDDLEGVEITCTVSHRTHEGKIYEDWEKERAPEGSDRAKAAEDGDKGDGDGDKAEDKAGEAAPAGRHRRVRA